MRRFFSVMFCLFFFCATGIFAGEDLKWGGKGYDPDLEESSRFMARASGIRSEQTLIEIWVDAKETVEDVGEIRLISEQGSELSSLECWKAMRHVTSPWACGFVAGQVKAMSGTGRIVVKDHSGMILLEEELNLDDLRTLAEAL